MKWCHMLPAILLVAAEAPASANFLTQMTFDEKMAQSDLVVIATAIAIDGATRDGTGDAATLAVVRRLKGESADRITVSTTSRIAEENPHCCVRGETYLMFLVRVPDGSLHSVNGAYGMIPIGSASSSVTVIPPPERP